MAYMRDYERDYLDALQTENELKSRLAIVEKERDEARRQRDEAEHIVHVEERPTRTALRLMTVERDNALAEVARLTDVIATYILGPEVANAFGVDLTDPSCPIGTALTVLANNIRSRKWKP
jgi:hypothetical protein